MATYKVLQDIEAEDKLVGPLTLRQCIYAAIAIIGMYLSYLCIMAHATFLVVLFLPFIGFGVFFAFPWNKQQSTEVWALAKIRFALKPRKRIWDQNGMKHPVEVTVPKAVEDPRQHRMTEYEVRSRLQALAATVDSRGWAVKNAPYNMNATTAVEPESDRLTTGSTIRSTTIPSAETFSDDMFDVDHNPIAQQFDQKITAASQAHRQQLVEQLNAPQPQLAPAMAGTAGQAAWYMGQPTNPPLDAAAFDQALSSPAGGSAGFAGPPAAGMPTPEEEALALEIKRQHEIMRDPHNNAHLKVILPLAEQQAQAQAQAQAAAAPAQAVPNTPLPAPQAFQAAALPVVPGMPYPQQPSYGQMGVNTLQPAPLQAGVPIPDPATVTPVPNPAILELATNNDLNVATIAREAQHRSEDGVDEVVISLH